MKITLTEKKEVSEDIEIETPAYFKGESWTYKIEEDKIIYINKTHAGFWNKENMFYNEYIQKALRSTKCEADEFNYIFSCFIESITGE